MHKIILFTWLFLGSYSALSAQSLIGKVMDQTGEPLQFVIVTHKSDHSHTDENGEFTINSASIGDTLFVEYLGFEDYKQVINSNNINTKILITLEAKLFKLDEITISKSVKSTNTIASIDLNVTPVNSSQEVLRRVPGLLIGQHAGGGKAEQIFLRGFDIDHGTDIALNVDGMPVNMVSHAHGQGYSDLHFIIPETIANIDFGKGPYYTDVGNFNTAGYVNFRTKDKLDRSTVTLDYGRFNSGRMLGMFDLLGSNEDQHAYIAAEYQQSDGPVESPQNFNRLNLMAKYSVETKSGDLISVLASKMQSKWDASGQIPQRLVDNGTITRFGSVDDTEGGSTSRMNLGITHSKILSDQISVKSNVFYSDYDFELFSNFTFFLEDPVNGDQIRQFENRNIYGLNSSLFQTLSTSQSNVELSYHIGLRYDDVNDVELSKTANRKTTLSNLSLGDVDETNFYTAFNATIDYKKWLFNGGVRIDYFNFNYVNRLSSFYDNQSVDRTIISPKLNLIYNQSNQFQYYLKTGIGFHSNDSRVVTSGSADLDLPAAYGADLGLIFKPNRRMIVNAALWYLFLEQEFVYVGDAGIVEPSGRTKRQGIDLSLRYQLSKYLFLNYDFTYTDAIAIDEAEDESFIPLAVKFMSTGGFSVRNYKGFSGGIRYRYIADRAANEVNSITALGYFITDINASYNFKNLGLGLTIENVFNTEWNEAQFATESRLRNEANSVEELHFTPGVPFFVKGSISYNF